MNDNERGEGGLPEQPNGPENIPVAKSFTLAPPNPVIPPRVPVEDLDDSKASRLRAA